MKDFEHNVLFWMSVFFAIELTLLLAITAFSQLFY